MFLVEPDKLDINFLRGFLFIMHNLQIKWRKYSETNTNQTHVCSDFLTSRMRYDVNHLLKTKRNVVITMNVSISQFSTEIASEEIA